jgi:hypothetical protein
MSNLKDRAAARLPLVPEPLAARFAEAMARLPRAQIAVRRPGLARDLPAVASFYG